MKIIDLQINLMNRKNFPLIKDEQLYAELTKHFKSPPEGLTKTEEEMVEELRHYEVKGTVCGGGWKVLGWNDLGEIRARNDYCAELKRKYNDVYAGFWVSLDPCWGHPGLKELERCITELGSYGIAVGGSLTGVPANDKLWYPYYEMCSYYQVPIKIWVGILAIKGKVPLWTENPIPYVDDVALKFPDLTIICAHHPWPFDREMAAVLIHHPNVYNEQHGTIPRYFSEAFKKEINTQIQDKIMFGSEYPQLSYERVISEWESAGYKPTVLEKIYRGNAQRVLKLED